MKKKKAKYSEYDSRGALNVACCECERGGNGKDKDKCSSGWKTKKWNFMSCFSGELMDTLTIEKEDAA